MTSLLWYGCKPNLELASGPGAHGTYTVGGCSLMGDVRDDRTAMILGDQYVALHAYRVELDNRLQLGNFEIFKLKAPIPAIWNKYLGIQKVRIQQHPVGSNARCLHGALKALSLHPE